jgi:hypothetical protein
MSFRLLVILSILMLATAATAQDYHQEPTPNERRYLDYHALGKFPSTIKFRQIGMFLCPTAASAWDFWKKIEKVADTGLVVTDDTAAQIAASEYPTQNPACRFLPSSNLYAIDQLAGWGLQITDGTTKGWAVPIYWVLYSRMVHELPN